MDRSLLAQNDAADATGAYAAFAQAILFIFFSWVMLPPLSVVVSGKFLARRIPLDAGTPQSITIHIPPIPKVEPIFKVQSSNSEVILGLGGFLLTLFFIGSFAGSPVHEIVRTGFGIQTEQYNCVAIFSSLMTVVWSSVLFVSIFIPWPKNSLVTRQEQLIDKLAKDRKQQGGSPP